MLQFSFFIPFSIAHQSAKKKGVNSLQIKYDNTMLTAMLIDIDFAVKHHTVYQFYTYFPIKCMAIGRFVAQDTTLAICCDFQLVDTFQNFGLLFAY